MEIQISVRNLVEFVLRSGNIDNRRAASPENAMQEGGRIHRMIQRRMGSDYHAEVSLRYRYETENYTILIEGRADGIILEKQKPREERELPDQERQKLREERELPDQERQKLREERQLPYQESQKLLEERQLADQEKKSQTGDDFSDGDMVTVDEIKGTYRELSRLKEASPLHLAQAKCYAFMVSRDYRLPQIRVRLTYCNMDTEEIRYFHYEFDRTELEEWFFDLIGQYRKWADFQFQWNHLRQQSIRDLQFPFPYREGQKKLVTYVYQTIYHRRKLFIEAPTGVGKTISTMFPAIKAMGEGKGQKLFYLTAKTITRTVADDTLTLLRREGLRFKSVILTAKDKICFMEERECNPDYCPYAKGHYDRINDGIYDLLTHTDSFTREAIEAYARRHQVCPFEMCLDMSLFSDGIICDYNYLFDPHVCLKRFFGEGGRGGREDYLFLIDEAHNLVERGREMYTAVLKKEDFLALKKLVKDYDMKMSRQLEKCNKELLQLKRMCQDYAYEDEASISLFVNALFRLSGQMEHYLEEHEVSSVRSAILDFYFEISHFLLIHDKLDRNYVIYTQMESDGGFVLKLFCVNPAKNLQECMKRGRSSILFSATLLPIGYYKRLLGAEEGDYEVYADSVFDPARKGLYIASDVTSRYTRRTEAEYYNIACYISRIISRKKGNYLVFFPSHLFLQNVYEMFLAYFGDALSVDCILQEEYMDEMQREDFLKRFGEKQKEEDQRSLLGFCVLGGIFSEGIDLKNDSLIGAVIVGTGLPQICNEREILKRYFAGEGENGFDYAYKYPGMNKVLQAAGRVIRTAEDMGVIALLDERFLNGAYLRMFPREWENYERVTLDRIEDRITQFWQSFEE